MMTFTTKNGTELPVSDMRGKPYLLVSYRIVWMREEHPGWAIETEIIRMEQNESIARATIRNDNGTIIAQATKREDLKGFGDHLEKAETGAIGRALALCGYGTQFCYDDLDEGNRLADSPVSAARKTPIVSHPRKSGDYVVSFGQHKGLSLKEIGEVEVRNYGSWITKQEKSAQHEEFINHAREFLQKKSPEEPK